MPDSHALPSVWLRHGDDTTMLLPGDVIGRLDSAGLCLDDPRISEVHAYVSLRGGQLVLLGLRGRLALHDRVCHRIELSVGQRIRLARDLAVEVTRVVLPDRVLALSGDALPRQVLQGTTSLVLDPEPTLQPGYVPGAPLQLWTRGATWHARQAGGRVTVVDEQSTWTLEGRRFRAEWVSLDTTSAAPTVSADGLRPPLGIHARYDSVQFTRDDDVILVISGRGAQLLSELVAFDGPVRWETLACEIWGRTDDVHDLRPRLDITLSRLRKKLTAAGLPRDLVRTDGCGQLELLLQPNDQVRAEL